MSEGETMTSTATAPINLGQWEAMYKAIDNARQECEIGNEKRPALMLEGVMEGLNRLPKAAEWHPSKENPYLAMVIQHVKDALEMLQQECPDTAARDLLQARFRWDSYGLSLGALS
jgi:hypothetical protein